MKRPILKWLIAFALLSESWLMAAEDRVADLTASAQKGDADAQLLIGILYANGDGIPKDCSEAVKWVRKAAEQGYAPAQYELGWMCNHTEYSGVPRDSTEAMRWFRKAAEQNYGLAQSELAWIFREGTDAPEDPVESEKWARKAWMNLTGQEPPKESDEVEKLVSKAIEVGRDGAQWYRRAAEQGFPSAQLRLGWMYEWGRAVLFERSTEAVKWYRMAAEQGFAPAQYALGRLHEQGKGVPQNNTEALAWYRKAATQGDRQAQFALGLKYSVGATVPKDGAEAVKWYRMAAAQGSVAALNNLGGMYSLGMAVPKDSFEAAKWYRKAAEQGDAGAQSILSRIYADGDGVAKDKAESAKWLRKAAENDDAESQATLGMTYALGDGVPRDNAEAVKWFRKAAEQQNKNGEYHLGLIYASGSGVNRDDAEAAKWLRKAVAPHALFGEHGGAKLALSFIEDPAMKALKQAADSGNPDAQFRIGQMYESCRWNGQPSWDGRTEAVSWYRLAAEQGSTKAEFALAISYRVGRGVPQDSAEAAKWYRKVADKGYPNAQSEMGRRCYSGDGVAKDDFEAAGWFSKAAENGNAEAQFYLGLMYSKGEGVFVVDYAEAYKWYRRAAEQGNVSAQGNLGSMYANGKGVPKDTIEGLAWSNIAAASGDDIFIKNRELLERQVGPDATLAAQQRSKQILKEIEAAKRAAGSSTPIDSAALISPASETPKASGSGAIVSTTGHVLTAAHVVAGASRVKIFTAQGMKTANVLRMDEANDLAVLKLAAGTYPALPVAPSRRIRLGQTVATIGFPNIEIQGFSPKVTRGEISSLNGIGDDPRAWQISVPVQPGNSGGALLDENGNVIGVVVSKLGLKAAQATGDIPQNVNYAVKSTYALALLEPYLDSSAPEPNPSAAKPRFEDMVAKAQQSVVLILVY